MLNNFSSPPTKKKQRGSAGSTCDGETELRWDHRTRLWALRSEGFLLGRSPKWKCLGDWQANRMEKSLKNIKFEYRKVAFCYLRVRNWKNKRYFALESCWALFVSSFCWGRMFANACHVPFATAESVISDNVQLQLSSFLSHCKRDGAKLLSLLSHFMVLKFRQKKTLLSLLEKSWAWRVSLHTRRRWEFPKNCTN